MKMSYVLMSLICVNVLADISIMKYIELVEISNLQILKASNYKDDHIENGLVHVLTVMINADHWAINYLNQMFTVPEHAKTLNFDLLQGIPAAKDENQSSTAHDNEHKRIYKATSTETLKLTELGKARRLLTGKAIIKVLTQKLAEIILVDEVDKEKPVERICALIAMWVSLKMSSNTYYVTYDDVCAVVLNVGEIEYFVKYRSFKGEYWQVNADTKKKELNAQLREDISTQLELTAKK
ncbi:uncharacterized protein LOC126842472 [Adelges cooleyi]|uniref:uncharacterized protein LOC126842472 n=1 Tax=Adelges cooleyi TaxID=133065 RepID=UPI00217FA4D5|nr:uncharacterized protein LOC126842472 [Adelges cooleyi]